MGHVFLIALSHLWGGKAAQQALAAQACGGVGDVCSDKVWHQLWELGVDAGCPEVHLQTQTVSKEGVQSTTAVEC